MPKILFAQKSHIDTVLIKKELSVLYERDQKVRKGDSVEFRNYVDSTNLIKVKSLIEKYGWPGRSFVGNMGNYTIWLIIQHADQATQEKYFPLMKASVEKNESRGVDLAYLEDRILMRQGKNQIYGTQVYLNPKTGVQEIWPIDDEMNVDERRAKLGLERMEDYAKHFGLDYKAKEK